MNERRSSFRRGIAILVGIWGGANEAIAQQSAKIPRIGVVSPGNPGPPAAAFEKGMRELGWLHGQNLLIERRYARGDLEQIPNLVSELIALPVDVLLASSVAIRNALEATQKVPIIMAFAVDDPVEEGWVANLGRPGGNVTGITLHAPELTGKRLELLKAALPQSKRIAVLAWSRYGGLSQLKAVERYARPLGLRHQIFNVQASSEYEVTFQRMKEDGSEAILVLSSATFFGERRRIAELAIGHRLPLVSPFREAAEAGALIAYGPNVVDLWGRRVPYYVDRILKGAKPGELPVEQSTKFDFVINLRTAASLGLTIPQSLVLRADEVIQ